MLSEVRSLSGLQEELQCEGRKGRPGAGLSESGVLGTRDTSVKNYIICKFQINDQVVLRWTSEHSKCKLNLD